MSRMIDMRGLRFGVLTVEHRTAKPGRTFWLCRCDCGQTREVVGHDLRKGAMKSCGCQRGAGGRLKWTKHGGVKTPEYQSWYHMRRRCSDPGSLDYENYGARGIAVCAEWGDFARFLSDMGPRPSKGHSIERRDNNLGYSPGNCVWATKAEQARNKRNVVKFEYKGDSLTIPDVAARAGLSYAYAFRLLRRRSVAQILEGRS